MTTLKNQVIALRNTLSTGEENQVVEQIKANCNALFELNPFKSEFYIKFDDELCIEIDGVGDLVLTVTSKIRTYQFRENIINALKTDEFFAECKIANQANEFIYISF